MKYKIINVVGARPQFIKAATIERIVRQSTDFESIIVHTGQHYDANMSKIFFDELNIPRPDYNLEVGSGSHGKQTAIMLHRIESILIKEKPDVVVVYGDTNSTIAAALAASKLHIPIAHVEAGLRSYNRKMPEEINRITTDRISDLLFCPTANSLNILQNEGLGSKAIFSGDVMFDSVLYYKKIIEKKDYLLPNLPKDYFFATIHRPQNTDNPERLISIFKAFSKLKYPVILPLHPRTKHKLQDIDVDTSNTKIIEPIGYLNLLATLMNANKVFTDSGGLQKEAFFMQKKCITLRDETEWIETKNDSWNEIVGADCDKIIEIANNEFIPKQQKQYFGNGDAAEIILKKIKEFL